MLRLCHFAGEWGNALRVVDTESLLQSEATRTAWCIYRHDATKWGYIYIAYCTYRHVAAKWGWRHCILQIQTICCKMRLEIFYIADLDMLLQNEAGDTAYCRSRQFAAKWGWRHCILQIQTICCKMRLETLHIVDPDNLLQNEAGDTAYCISRHVAAKWG
jgi:predicted DNA-binding protein (UPF0251 family)